MNFLNLFSSSTKLRSILFNLVILSILIITLSNENFKLVKCDDRGLDAENAISKKTESIEQKKDAEFIDKDHLKHGPKNDLDEEDDKDDSDSKEHNHKEHKQIKTSFGFIHAFFASLSVIVVSEIGDKTFFIAAIMAMKHPRLTVYSGAMLALGLMTLLSALLGNILTKLIPKVYTYYASSILFGLFGLKMLREGWHMDPAEANEEYEEANSTLRENEEKSASFNGKNLETGGGDDSKNTESFLFFTRRFVILFRKYISAVFLQAFVLTFLAEWGDRSQISTIILGARENMIGTVLGGTIGHGLCTGLAVIGGRMISQRISVRTVTLIGAFVFLFFAFSAFFIGPDAY